MSEMTPFQNFRACIGGIAHPFGDSLDVWAAVAHEFDEALEHEIAARRGCRRYDLPFAVRYLMAEDEDFGVAAGKCGAMFAVAAGRPAVARGAWGKAELALREGEGVWLEAGGNAMAVVLVGSPRPVTGRLGQTGGQQFPVFLTEFGKRCLGSRFGGGKPTSVNARSAEGADKAARKMAEEFFGVRMDRPDHVTARLCAANGSCARYRAGGFAESEEAA